MGEASMTYGPLPRPELPPITRGPEAPRHASDATETDPRDLRPPRNDRRDGQDRRKDFGPVGLLAERVVQLETEARVMRYALTNIAKLTMALSGELTTHDIDSFKAACLAYADMGMGEDDRGELTTHRAA